jgi:NodT family efflux transporter outer membrane factor (OMF) lipoprotein
MGGRLLLACLFAGALLGSGCFATGPLQWIDNGFKVGPNYCQPSAPVADEWIEAHNPAIDSRHIEDWWTVFQDPTLNSLIGTAHDHNLNLRVAGARVLESRAQANVAMGNLFPQSVQAGGQYSRVNISHNIFNSPSTELALFPPLPPGTPLGNNYSDWNVGFNMSWELDFWGRYRRAIESANATLDASIDAYDDALVTLLADVATNYVQYRVAQQRIKIARDNVHIQEGVVKLTEDKFKAGTGTRLDVEQAKTILEQTRSTIPGLEIVQGQANDTLCTLLGMPPHDLSAELGSGPELGVNPMPTTPNTVAAGIPCDLLRQRPDVRLAERQVAAQTAQIGIAEADLYPIVAINGTLGWEAYDLSKLFTPGSFMGNITPNVRWNILNFGRIKNNVRQQVARTQEFIAAYQNQVLTAQREVQDALRGFVRSQEQAEDLAKSVDAAAAATKVGLQQYRAGIVPFNTVFNLETTQVQQQDALAVVQGNVALNLISVYRGLGGGWEIRCHAKDCTDAAEEPKLTPPKLLPEQLPYPAPVPEGSEVIPKNDKE